MERRIGICGIWLAAVLGLPGCMPDIGVSKSIPPFTAKEDKPRTLIDRALSGCSGRTVAAETGCVKKAVDGAALSVAGLVALVPHCRVGQLCTYDYTTEDRIGFIAAYATRPVVSWRVTFDLSQKPKAVADVPITVEVL